MSVLLTRTIELLLFPPGINLILLTLGLILLRKARRVAVSVIALALGTLYLASTPFVAYALMDSLQRTHPALMPADLQRSSAQAIVVLGAGRKYDAPEYGGNDTVSRLALERLRYGAYLQRHTGLPLLVTGGSPYNEAMAEAHLMKAALENDFRIPVQWVEDHSNTTAENAIYSQAMLAQANIQHVYLVTHAWHMPRSIDVFQKTGLHITPAPTAFATPSPAERAGLAWLPSARALEVFSVALHEVTGRLWYWMGGKY